MKRPIITDINFLRQQSEPSLYIEEQNALIKDLEDSLDLTKGIGLSAIQIGLKKKVSIVRIGQTKINLINAEIIEKEEKYRFIREGCLSLPCIYIDTMRYKYIKVNNNGTIFVSEGLEAVCILHEISHQKGRILYDDKWRAR